MRGLGAGALVLTLVSGAALAAPPRATGKAIAWSAFFRPERAPREVHFRARVKEAGATHTVEVWRRGREALKRTVDGASDTFVAADPRAGLAVTVVDRATGRTRHTSVRELLAQGTLLDWDELAHGVRKPWHGDQLRRMARAGKTAAGGRCRWHWLQRKGGPAVELCWSERWQLPLLVKGERGEEIFVVEAVDEGPVGEAVRAPRGAGHAEREHED